MSTSRRSTSALVALLLTLPSLGLFAGSSAAAETATQIAVQAGNDQSAPVGSAVATPPSVVVKDVNNNPVSGVEVTFAVASGGGTIDPASPATVTTDGNGIATLTSWTLGATTGANTLTATIPGSDPAVSMTFTATGVVGPPTHIAAAAGENQSAPVGTAVATPPSVVVRDVNNNPVPGVAVTFAEAAGGGTIDPASPATVTTDANGVAALTSWTLGSALLGNTLTATVAGLSGSPVTFAATGTLLDPCTPSYAGCDWTIRESTADNEWLQVAYGDGLWVAVANTGTGNRVMTSPDGINWTLRNSAADRSWVSVAYGNGLWVAVAFDSGGAVMTSPDGITWTMRDRPSTNTAWHSVAYGNGLWVAVATTGTNRVMTSPDGITWTSQAAAAANSWHSVAYANGLWVAVAGTGAGNRVMTSPDGITWTSQASAADNTWLSVAYGNGLWVAVAGSGAGDRVMTSPDGITWTSRTSAADNGWRNVAYGNGLWVAVATTGTNRVMTSPDGITWTARTPPVANSWHGVGYGNGQFVAVANSGAGNRVMTSGQVPPGTPTTLAIATDAAGAASGAAFTTQPVVEIRDSYGTRIASTAAVTMTVSVGGTVVGTATVDAVDGVATFANVGFSGTVGSYTLTFSSGGLNTATQSIALTAGAPSQIAVAAGNNQSATVGTAVATAPSAVVRDANDNPVPGAEVTFSVTSGGGTINPASPATVTTDGNGIATLTSWTLGTTTGANTLTATITGSDPAVSTTFTATGVVGVPTISAVLDPQSATAGTAVATAPSVVVRDANNDPVPDVEVTFEVTSGGGTIDPASPARVITNSEGFAALTSWMLGATAGENSVVATITGLPAVSTMFTATGLVGPPAQIAAAANDDQSAPVGTAVATPPSVVVRDVNNNPVPEVAVTFAEATGGGTIDPASPATVTTDANGVAALTGWTLGTTAGPNTLTATVEGSDPAIVTTLTAVAVTVPSAPRAVLISPGTGSVHLSWSPPEDLGGRVESYRIVGPGTQGESFGAGVRLSARMTGLANGTPVTFQVCAANAAGESCSVPVTATPKLSSTGEFWTEQPQPGPGWQDIAFGDGVFVAVGTNAFMRSTDGGVTWSAIENPPSASWRSVTFGDGVFVAVAMGGTIAARSVDGGETWTTHTVENRNWISVAFGNGVFVAASNNSPRRYMRSADGGETWTGFVPPSNSTFVSVAYGDGVFVAGALTGPRLQRSDDNGQSFIDLGTAFPLAYGDWRDIGYGNGVFVVKIRSDESVVRSTDGARTWVLSATTVTGTQDFRGIAYGNGLFVAVSVSGENRVIVSADGGLTWTVPTIPVVADWISVAYGDGVFVAVAASGRIIRSAAPPTEIAKSAGENQTVTVGTAPLVSFELDMSFTEAGGTTIVPALPARNIAGATVRVSGKGMMPNTSLVVRLTRGGTAVRTIGTIAVGVDGTFADALRLDGTGDRATDGRPLPFGRQILQFVGLDESGEAFVIERTVTIGQSSPSPERLRATGALPTLAAGASLATNAGMPETVRVVPQPDGLRALIEADSWRMSIGISSGHGGVMSLTEGRTLVELGAGAPVEVSGEGFLPGSRADLWLFSTPTHLGSVIVGPDGRFTGQVEIDREVIALGEHTLQLCAVGQDGYLRAANLGVVVRSDGDEANAEEEGGDDASDGAPPAPNDRIEIVTAEGTDSNRSMSRTVPLVLLVATIGWLLMVGRRRCREDDDAVPA